MLLSGRGSVPVGQARSGVVMWERTDDPRCIDALRTDDGSTTTVRALVTRPRLVSM
ncbi:hypothetical protein SCOCK_630047 [Actinacidiphila cocklensis]|uniref:Uncharacterized protein n=1 Tax=Actinacidiphila cocklensis TaxID=887465 RepID=A0A9W4DZ93_9ACTN|nr:hypothetical protein SCOCK_630047 [Actinacidiphila cocklensis]